MRNLKIFFTLFVALLTLTANAFAECDPADTNCTETTTAAGNLVNGGNWNYGNNANGGFANTVGALCGNSAGAFKATFDSALTGTNLGSTDSNGTSASKAVLDFSAKATFDIGNAAITGGGSVAEGSISTATDPNSLFYRTALQTAGATMANTTVSTTNGGELNFNKTLSAEGAAGGSVDPDNKIVSAFANNTANGITTAYANNAIGGGIQGGGGMAEFTGTANITCPGGIVSTNGVGSAALTTTTLPNGFTMKATANVSEMATKQ